MKKHQSVLLSVQLHINIKTKEFVKINVRTIYSLMLIIFVKLVVVNVAFVLELILINVLLALLGTF